MSVLRDYMSYAKECIHPRLDEEASQRLVTIYVEMRKAGAKVGIISAYPRQLESLIRLSEAHAKVRLSTRVEVADVEEAWRLHKEAVKQSATDPLTGRIDLSIITTGSSHAARKLKEDMGRAIKRLLENRNKLSTINTQKLLEDLKKTSNRVNIQKLIIYSILYNITYITCNYS
jgi:DNA replication licensing factor MCM4